MHGLTAKELYLEKYIDEFGRCQLYPRSKNKRREFDNENSVLFTAYMLVHFRVNSIQDSDWENKIVEVIEKSFHVKGLLMREPKLDWNYYPDDHPRESGFNYNAHDNYIGMVICAILLDRVVWIGDTIDYLKANYFSLNDEKPYEFTLRQVCKPYVYCYLKVLDDSSNVFHQSLLFFSFISTGLNKSDDMSGELIKFYMYQTLVLVNKTGFIISLAYKIYTKLLERRFSGQWLVRIHEGYFKDRNHPIIEFARHFERRELERMGRATI